MKALSVRAPWWWFILHGGKDIENRDWRTNFRGRVLIHAGKWWNSEEVKDDAETAVMLAPLRATPGPEITFERMRKFGGCIVGSVEIADCVEDSVSPWFFGRFGFVLRNVIALPEPIPFKGALGFFDVPDHLLRQHGVWLEPLEGE